MAEADKVAAGALQQAIGVLRNILSSPETVISLASSLERPTGSSARNTTHSTLESEMRALFRPGSSQVDALAGQTATVVNLVLLKCRKLRREDQDIRVTAPSVVNLVLLKCRKLRREDQETSDWIVSRILY